MHIPDEAFPAPTRAYYTKAAQLCEERDAAGLKEHHKAYLRTKTLEMVVDEDQAGRAHHANKQFTKWAALHIQARHGTAAADFYREHTHVPGPDKSLPCLHLI